MDPDPHGAGTSPKTRPGASVPDPDSVEVKMAEKDGFFFFLLLLEESLRERGKIEFGAGSWSVWS